MWGWSRWAIQGMWIQSSAIIAREFCKKRSRSEFGVRPSGNFHRKSARQITCLLWLCRYHSCHWYSVFVRWANAVTCTKDWTGSFRYLFQSVDFRMSSCSSNRRVWCYQGGTFKRTLLYLGFQRHCCSKRQKFIINIIIIRKFAIELVSVGVAPIYWALIDLADAEGN